MFNGRYAFTDMMNPHYQEISKAYNIPYDLVVDRKDLRFSKVEKCFQQRTLFLGMCN